MRPLALLVACLPMVALLSGCAMPADCDPVAPDPDRTGPGSPGEDGMRYRATVTDKTTVEEYAVPMAAGQAEVVWDTHLTNGSIRLEMLDACGQRVYDADNQAGTRGITRLSDGGGEPGTWLVRWTFTAASGTVDTTIQGA